jgi:hypothetical protein
MSTLVQEGTIVFPVHLPRSIKTGTSLAEVIPPAPGAIEKRLVRETKTKLSGEDSNSQRLLLIDPGEKHLVDQGHHSAHRLGLPRTASKPHPFLPLGTNGSNLPSSGFSKKSEITK